MESEGSDRKPCYSLLRRVQFSPAYSALVKNQKVHNQASILHHFQRLLGRGFCRIRKDVKRSYAKYLQYVMTYCKRWLNKVTLGIRYYADLMYKRNRLVFKYGFYFFNGSDRIYARYRCLQGKTTQNIGCRCQLLSTISFKDCINFRNGLFTRFEDGLHGLFSFSTRLMT